ncbi:hypothetical protein P168DRAFT_44721 [Aspergillus campestris IBT 28561]|uniref:Uncharacterized protein n=1 Tax=Aspergillus campestris (strain IBT 28561) TaxID=1392248 RepID=A0A2I1CXI1_ASPC2|nr:uncharacterized protein P168DRAFT_44721 [Aspergillus campestris IBT 28561]PKY02313.1 hypothetical protein P168DRAFT_44721 [Aspergillus campestris IBT 28561]
MSCSQVTYDACSPLFSCSFLLLSSFSSFFPHTARIRQPSGHSTRKHQATTRLQQTSPTAENGAVDQSVRQTIDTQYSA